MDQNREQENGVYKPSYGLWFAIAATAAGLTAASFVVSKRRSAAPTKEIGRVLSRCESAANALGRRIAQA